MTINMPPHTKERKLTASWVSTWQRSSQVARDTLTTSKQPAGSDGIQQREDKTVARRAKAVLQNVFACDNFGPLIGTDLYNPKC